MGLMVVSGFVDVFGGELMLDDILGGGLMVIILLLGVFEDDIIFVIEELMT